MAIKSISRAKLGGNRKHEENLDSEIGIMQTLQHPNIVRLLELQHSERHIYLIMDFCAGGDLSAFLRRHHALPLHLVQHFARQLKDGLQLLHSRQLIHRDLKPQNLLLDQSSSPHTAVLKIADFGFARSLQGEDMAATLCGSPLYMAPEILRYHPYDGKADLWSVGAIVYEMVAGRPPYTGQNHIQLLQRIEREDVTFPPNAQLSADCRDFILRLLKRKAEERMSFHDFFNHPFVQARESRNNRAQPEEVIAAAAAAAAPPSAVSSLQASSALYNQSVTEQPRQAADAAEGETAAAATAEAPTAVIATVLPAPFPTRSLHRSELEGEGEEPAAYAAERREMIGAASPPIDIPAPLSSYQRDAPASPAVLPPSSSPPLPVSQSPPSPTSSLAAPRRRLSSASSRSGSFDERQQQAGLRKDSASSGSGGSGSGTGSKQSGGSLDGEFVMVDKDQPAASNTPSPRLAAPHTPTQLSQQPSFASTMVAGMGKLPSLALSFFSPAVPAGSDSPRLGRIVEEHHIPNVPYTCAAEADGLLHEMHDSAASPSRPAASHSQHQRQASDGFRQQIARFREEAQQGWTVAKAGDFYRAKHNDQLTALAPLPISVKLSALLPAGSSLSLLGCALALYVKALRLLLGCVEAMDDEYGRIMQQQGFTTEELRTSLLAAQQSGDGSASSFSATSSFPLSADTPFASNSASWQELYRAVVQLIDDYSAAATVCAQQLRAAQETTQQQTVAVAAANQTFDIGSRSLQQLPEQPLPSPSLPSLSSSSAANGQSSLYLTFASSNEHESPLSPAVAAAAPAAGSSACVDPLLACYHCLLEWWTAGVMSEGSDEWQQAGKQYSRARTLARQMQREIRDRAATAAAERDCSLLQLCIDLLQERRRAVRSEERAEQDRRARAEASSASAAIELRAEQRQAAAVH